jgi:hypothetical protein
VKEGDLPVLMTKALWEVFKISCFVPLDVIESYQKALLIGYLVHKNFAEDVLDCRSSLQVYTGQVLAEVFVIDDIYKVDHQILQSQREHAIDSLVVLWA